MSAIPIKPTFSFFSPKSADLSQSNSVLPTNDPDYMVDALRDDACGNASWDLVKQHLCHPDGSWCILKSSLDQGSRFLALSHVSENPRTVRRCRVFMVNDKYVDFKFWCGRDILADNYRRETMFLRPLDRIART